MAALAKIKIFGFVQGVFFRHSSKNKARELHLSGFAKNEADGSVYMEIEGEENKIKEFLEWCRKGPPFAKVNDIKYEVSHELRHYKDFEIK